MWGGAKLLLSVFCLSHQLQGQALHAPLLNCLHVSTYMKLGNMPPMAEHRVKALGRYSENLGVLILPVWMSFLYKTIEHSILWLLVE